MQDTLGTSDKYTQYFHEFVLSVADDEAMMSILQNVKEGILIYEGIRYSSNINEIGSWNSKLCLVLDTEVLFAIGGYNSSLYQAMYSELDKYIKEINRGCTSQNSKIKLYYFSETKKEIDYYFESAEKIVRGLDSLDPTKEAMGQIVNECKKASDVQTKKTLFFEKLRTHNVNIIDKDFYDTGNNENIEYNLEDFSLHEKYSDLWNEKKENVHKSLVCLSHINVLRKGNSSSGFENCGYIFLTATGRTLKLSVVPELLENGNVPLATTFDFLINRFWFKLNKGFGNNRTPRTMDMVMRSRHILATIINSKASEKYDEFKEQYEKDKITKEEFWALNNSLRSQLKMPNEIDKDTIGVVIDDLDRWDMEEIIEQEKKRALELRNVKSTISQLTEKLDESIKSQDALRSQLEATQNELDSTKRLHDLETAHLNEDIEKEKEINRKNTEDINYLKSQLADEQKLRKEKERKEQEKKYRLLCTVTAILILVGMVGFVYGSVMELIWAKIISAIIEVSAVISIVVSVVKSRKPKKE